MCVQVYYCKYVCCVHGLLCWFKRRRKRRGMKRGRLWWAGCRRKCRPILDERRRRWWWQKIKVGKKWKVSSSDVFTTDAIWPCFRQISIKWKEDKLSSLLMGSLIFRMYSQYVQRYDLVFFILYTSTVWVICTITRRELSGTTD